MNTTAPAHTQPTTAVITYIGWIVPSASEPGVNHTVFAHGVNGLLRCSCRAGQWNRMCHHVRSVVKGQAGRPIVRATVHARPVEAA